MEQYREYTFHKYGPRKTQNLIIRCYNVSLEPRKLWWCVNKDGSMWASQLDEFCVLRSPINLHQWLLGNIVGIAFFSA